MYEARLQDATTPDTHLRRRVPRRRRGSSSVDTSTLRRLVAIEAGEARPRSFVLLSSSFELLRAPSSSFVLRRAPSCSSVELRRAPFELLRAPFELLRAPFTGSPRTPFELRARTRSPTIGPEDRRTDPKTDDRTRRPTIGALLRAPSRSFVPEARRTSPLVHRGSEPVGASEGERGSALGIVNPILSRVNPKVGNLWPRGTRALGPKALKTALSGRFCGRLDCRSNDRSDG